MLRLAGITYESLVNGPGIRRVFFAQGCNKACTGCHNPETWDYTGGQDFSVGELLLDVLKCPYLQGITLSGGEPFDQAEEFTQLVAPLRTLGLTVWCYTGYLFEDIVTNPKHYNLLSFIDVLVDGKFDITLYKDNLKLRGSTNQRIISVDDSLKSGQVVELSHYYSM